MCWKGCFIEHDQMEVGFVLFSDAVIEANKEFKYKYVNILVLKRFKELDDLRNMNLIIW